MFELSPLPSIWKEFPCISNARRLADEILGRVTLAGPQGWFLHASGWQRPRLRHENSAGRPPASVGSECGHKNFWRRFTRSTLSAELWRSGEALATALLTSAYTSLTATHAREAESPSLAGASMWLY